MYCIDCTGRICIFEDFELRNMQAEVLGYKTEKLYLRIVIYRAIIILRCVVLVLVDQPH